MPSASFCREPGLGLLRVFGRDARRFLHAQTTQRIDDLRADETRLAAWLNAKGRVLGLFDVVPDGDGYLLLLPADNAAAVCAGLKRYVLRDDVRIEPLAGRSVSSIVGSLDAWLAECHIALPRGAVAVEGDAILARTGAACVELITGAERLPRLVTGLAESTDDAVALAAIAAGRPEVPAALTDRYTPHMLNLESLGAISFNKGCYPGQEIVARTQHRGEAKRRIRRFRCGGGERPSAGAAIVDATGAAAGEVNRVAATAEGFELLAVVTLEALQSSLRLADSPRPIEPMELTT